jgi:uncharacterized OsmC-like protein
MTTDTAPLTDPMANAGDTRLWVERAGHRDYVGHNSRGASVHVGSVGDEGAFSPGELLKIAAAACVGLTGDHALSRRLGDDVAVTVEVGGPTDEREDRYPAIAERLVINLTGLTDDERDRLLVVLRRAIDEHCTVGRTLEAGAAVTLTIDGEG